VARRLSLKEPPDIELLRAALKELGDAHMIQKAKRGKFGHLELQQSVRGTIQVTRQGMGFVTSEAFEEDILIPPGFLGTALNGDTVEVSLFAQSHTAKEHGKRREGEVVRVLARAKETLVGTVEQRRKTYSVVPDDRKFPVDVAIDAGDLLNAQPGDKVVVQIRSWGGTRLSPEGVIVEVLGRAGEVQTELLSVAREFKLPMNFPSEILEAAERIPTTISAGEIMRRLDFRQEICFTIDPDDAKDFDDAVSLDPLPGGLSRLGVHIADVSAYVKEGTELDQEAYRRGTSVYFPNMVIPMLPEQLSNIVCSLRPHEDRLAFSVFMTVTPKGEIKDYEIRESVIRSARRFTYEEVEAILHGQPSDDPLPVLERLRAMHELSTVLTRKRMKEGSIDFESSEAKFRFDRHGKPVEIIKKVRLDSHRLVEEFMLLANKVVAMHIGLARKEDHVKPFIYRVHDSPDPDRIRELAAFVERLGFKLTLDGGVSSKAMQRLLDQVRGTEVENVINEVALRSMAKAVYSERNIGHYGLAFDYYAHFTSPIRRYPDLVVHRLLKEYRGGMERGRREHLLQQLPDIARHSSVRERVAMEAERAAVKVMQVEYMKRHLGDEFEGVISGATRFGMFVEINDLLVEGMIHVRDLKDDYYVYDEKNYALMGRRTGKRYRLGDSVRLKVVRVNAEEREIDFTIVEESTQARSGKRHRN
jgi:ribonuclease R